MREMPRTELLKKLIWLYLFLLIFEGSLRKWILPGFATPLLIIRDPVVIAIYLISISRGCWPNSKFLPLIGCLAAVCFVVSFLGKWSTFSVTLFGMRTNFLHLPLIFLMPKVLDRTDVILIGKWILRLSVPMAALVYLQFQAAPTAWVNAGVGVGEQGQMMSVFGRIRPPGTFSYNTGLTTFAVLAATFLYFSALEKQIFGKWLARIALISVVITVGLSGSRTSLGFQGILLVAVVFICFMRPGLFGRSVYLFITVAMMAFLASGWSVYQTGMDVLNSRIVGSGGVKEGIVDRFFGTFLTPFEAATQAPLLGYGLGVGTNAGAALLHGGEREFLLAEGDLARVVMESGPLLGFAFIFLRLMIVIRLATVSWRSLNSGNCLPMLIFAGCFLDVFMAQFGQPTALGFACFSAGMCLASARVPPTPLADSVYVGQSVEPRATILGRSPHAESLHAGKAQRLSKA